MEERSINKFVVGLIITIIGGVIVGIILLFIQPFFDSDNDNSSQLQKENVTAILKDNGKGWPDNSAFCITLSKPLTKDKDFNVTAKYIQGNVINKTIKIKKGNSSGMVEIPGAFFGFEYMNFVITGSNSWTFEQYIDLDIKAAKIILMDEITLYN